MSQPIIQTSFHAGEWAPPLNARVDIAKYHSAAALLRNFFVDYRGGASTRTGTRYILQCKTSNKNVRLIPFQASFTVTYMLEFGDFYIRPYNNGAPVLEAPVTITGATGNTFTATNSYAVGDWVQINGVVGITNVNTRYFIISAATATNFSVTDLFGNVITMTGTYTSGGTAQRVFTITSPYAAADLSLLKFSQNVNQMIICNQNYQPYVLTLNTATNWTLLPIVFGATVSAPTAVTVTNSGIGTGGGWNYSYIVTANDSNGQESPVSSPGGLTNQNDQRTNAGTMSVTWTASPGAVSYNVYKAELTKATVAVGAAYGFIGNVTGTQLDDSNIPPNFTQGPPVAQNPFGGAPVDHINVTNEGSYTSVPSVIIAAAPAGFITATGQAVLQAFTITTGSGGSGYHVGDIVTFGTGQAAITVQVTSSSSAFAEFIVINRGAITSGSTPANPIAQSSTSGTGSGATINVGHWGVGAVTILNGGSGYLTAPAVSFSPASTTAATAVLGAAISSNPGVVSFYQQRMVLANKPSAVQTFYMSQPGSYYNFNISNPINADNAITGSIVAGQLNEIKSMIAVPTGLMILSSRAAWLVNGGSGGAAITPIDVQANAHSFNGASDVPPIVANYDILFVQSKGSIVRDLSFNFYAQVFTGTDISILSSHLFYGFTLNEWAWAEEPFKVVWAVRNDGTLLSLTFLKEQELIGWSHHDTNGTFVSVATITETSATAGSFDAVYVIAQRTINGQTVKYVERFSERFFNGQVKNAWCVDAGLRYSGAPATTFSGLDHLVGMTVTGLADGVVIPPTTVSAAGSVTLGTAASLVTIGLAYTCQLQTLALDTGEPTIQGKRKSISGVTVRCSETLGLQIGRTFASAIPMKDLVVGNLNVMTNTVVSDLQTADARTIVDPSWDVPGQYCIQQSQPLPATILGVIPEIEVGDTK